jgi:Iap family predicted aminopeptidase
LIPVLSISLTACTHPAEPTPDPEDPLTADALAAATAALTDLGPRQVATPAEAEARDVVEDAFREAGLADVAAEPFVFDAWLPGEASVTIGEKTWSVEALSPSPETDLTAELTDDPDDAAGKVLLLSSDDGSRAEEFVRATTSGAVAMIRVTEEVDPDGSPLVEVGHTLSGTSFPSVAVDHATGARLKRKLGQQATIHIAPNWARDHESANVVGRVPGSGAGQVFVVAHYDSWHPSESAFDNALGVGALVQLAKAATALDPDPDLVFLATSGEEQGLQGSIAWASAHADEIGPGDLVITLDVLWSAEGEFIVMATDPELLSTAMGAATAEGLTPVDGGDPGIASDHFPFVTRGADAVWCGRWPDRHYHTSRDLYDTLDFDDAARGMRSQWRVLQAAAGEPVGSR